MRTIPPISLLVCGAAMVIGIFLAVEPEQAAKLWGQRSLNDMRNGAAYRRLYRATGLLLFLAGLLIAIDTMLYHRPPAPVMRTCPLVSITPGHPGGRLLAVPNSHRAGDHRHSGSALGTPIMWISGE